MSNRADDGSLRIELFVDDVERSADFYARVLGFTRESTGSGYVPMRRGRAVIGIGLARNLPAEHPIKPREGERAGIGVEIVIEVDDVDAAYRRVVDAGWPVHTTGTGAAVGTAGLPAQRS